MIYHKKIAMQKKTLYFLLLPLLTIFFVAYPLASFILASLTSFLYKKNTLNYIYTLSFITMLFFFSSLKPFGDISEYINIYNGFGSGKIDIFEFTRFGYGIEILYPAFMNIIGIVTGYNEQLLLLFTYAGILTLIAFIIKDSKELKLLFFASITLNLCFVEVTSYFIRQVLSVLFFLYALEKKRNLKYALFLVSILFHLSSIINIFLYVAFKLFTIKTKLSNSAKIFILAIISISILLIFINSPYYAPLFDRIFAIINNDKFTRLPINYILLTCANFIFIITIQIKYKFLIGFKSFLFYKEILFFILLLPFPTFSNRFTIIIFAFPAYFLLGIIENKKINKKAILTIFLFINTLPFLYLIYNVTNNLNLYTFMENKPLTESLVDLIKYFNHTINNGITFINKGNG